MKKPEVIVKTFFKTEGEYVDRKRLEVQGRNIEDILKDLPQEFIGFFYDQFVGVIDGKEYPFGPLMNKSEKYYKCSEHYVSAQLFVEFYAPTNGWTKEDMMSDMFKTSAYSLFNDENYPRGVVIIEQVIQNPGKTGIIISEKTIRH